MGTMKRKWDFLSKENRKTCCEEIIAYFREKREEEIGIIAAEEILDFFLHSIGTRIYNKGIGDAKERLQQRFYDLDVDLEVLLQK